jgi:hypothetical protein
MYTSAETRDVCERLITIAATDSTYSCGFAPGQVAELDPEGC